MKTQIYSIFILVNCIFSYSAYSQSACDNALYEADKLYEAGKIQDCINILQPCASEQKNKEYQIQTYRLLALAYMNLNNVEMARENIVKLLKLKPDYHKYPNIDPAEFSRLINEYTVSPKLYCGVKFGFNVNSVALHNSYSTYSSSQRYLPALGYQAGINGVFSLKKGYGIYTEILYSGVGIKHVVDDAGGWEQRYNEQQDYFNLNIAAVKQFNLFSKLSLHAGLGAGIGYMNKANIYLEAVNNQTESIQLASRSAIDERIRIQPSGQAMVGLAYPVASGIVSLDAGFAYYFRNTVNPDNRMDDMNFIFNNQYINDDISLRIFTVNVNYKIPIIWDVNLGK